MNYDIYIASPFFNKEQLSTVKIIEDELDKNEIKYFSPRKSGINFSTIPKEQREEASLAVFRSNVESIDNSSILLACIDDRDTGTAWEIGYHYGSRKAKSFIVTFSAKNYGVNVMLAKCTMLHLKNIEETLLFINKLKHCSSAYEAVLVTKEHFSSKDAETIE